MIDKNKVKELALEWLEGKEYFLVDATVDEQGFVVTMLNMFFLTFLFILFLVKFL